MSVTRKVTGLTMIVAGFTFFAWFIALNTISPAIPEGLQGTARLFMILSGITGLGFLVSGGMTFFGHDQYVQEQKNFLEKSSFKTPPKPLFFKPAAQTAPAVKEPEEDVTIEVDEEKKKEDEEKKEGWDAPSKTGWG